MRQNFLNWASFEDIAKQFDKLSNFNELCAHFYTEKFLRFDQFS